MYGHDAGAVPTVHVGAHWVEREHIYLDPRISFNEIPQYFFSGCACAYFQVATDVYTDLRFNSEEWSEDLGITQ